MSDSPFPPAPPPAPVEPEVSRPASYATLSYVALVLTQAMASVGNTRATAESWTDEFWATCGYEKGAVLDALTELEKLTRIYAGQAGLSGMQDFSADAAVLTDQAPPATTKG